MAVTLSSLAGAGAQFFDDNGVPLAGGLIYTYAAGTTTPAVTYTSSTGLTAHANPIVLDAAGRIATGEVWLTTGVDYKFLVKTSTNVQLGSYDNIPSINDFTSIYAALSNTTDVALGDALVGFRQSNSSGLLSNAVGRTVHQKLQDIVSVQDFGATGNGTTDDTVAIQNAINSFASTGGTLYFAPGTYKVTSSINVNKPMRLIGGPQGQKYFPATDPAVKLLWGGAAGGSVIKLGGFGAAFCGGGIENFCIDGNYIAANGLHIKDYQQGYFNSIAIINVATNGLLFENTTGSGNPSGMCTFDDLYIAAWDDTATNLNANGININGANDSAAEGVTQLVFRRARITHANGAGVLIGDFGDTFTWELLWVFRPNVYSGNGVWFASTLSRASNGNHLFMNPSISAGMRFDTPGQLLHRVINLNDSPDQNTNISGPVVGHGVGMVQIDTGLGGAFGRGLIPDFNFISHSDSMSLIRYDSANSILHTNQGNWKTSVSAGGNIVSANQVGSAIRLTTGATLNNINAVYDVATLGAGDGLASTYSTALKTIVATYTLTNVVYRVGLVDGNGDAPTNGIYFEFDSSVSAYWRCVCVKAGVVTTLISTLIPFVERLELYIFIEPRGEGVNFYYGTVAVNYPTLIGTITTNIPTAPISVISRVKTLAASDATFDVYAIKLGTQDEYL